MSQRIPQVAAIDAAFGLLFEGYEFISKRCDRLHTDIFETRLVLNKTICLRGQAAAKVFYDTEKFSRQKAAPKRVQKTLLGEGGVQGLDGEAHRQRKDIFMGLMTPERLNDLAELTGQQWQRYAQKWVQQERVVLFDEVEEMLCRSVCAWSGVPLADAEVAVRTRDLSAMISGSGRLGPQHWRAQRARDRGNCWIENRIEAIRNQTLDVPENTAAHAFAWHRSPDGNWLDLRVAAVDLLNVLRPTVAIARYITFAALALHNYPEERQKLKGHNPEAIHRFTQEVRRFYPFFPFAAACVRHDFEWQEYPFPEGTRVLLDLYGTNRDPDRWERPHDFWPDRFLHWQKNRYDFIPQGGGDHYINHRCAGEWLTIRLMDQAIEFLVNHLDYQVPPQNLSVNLAKIPTLPQSRFIMTDVRSS